MELVSFSQSIIQGALIGSIYGLIALGLTMVWSITRLLNFAHGDFLGLAMYLSFTLFAAYRIDPYVSVVVTVPVMVSLGLLIYWLLFRRVLHEHLLMVVQLTLALVFILEGSLNLIFGGDPKRSETLVSASRLLFFGISIPVTHLIAFAVTLAVSVILYLGLTKTDFGRQIRATVQSQDAALLMGIRVERVRASVFALGLGLLGLTASLVGSIFVLSPFMGLQITLFAFIVAVLGGIGNFVGTMLAGIILGIAQTLGNFFLPGSLAMLVPYGVFVLVLLIRPKGLLS